MLQGLGFVLKATNSSTNGSLDVASSILQGSQIAIALCLLGSSLLVEVARFKQKETYCVETQPLLGNGNGSAKSKQPAQSKGTDQEELDRQEIRNRPLWQYLFSFKVFVPYMYPRSRRQQAFLCGMLICSALTRIVTVALPLILGAIVNRLGTEVPWGLIGAYGLLQFLASPAGLCLIEHWLTCQVTTDMTIALNRHSYDHIMSLSADFHDSKRSSVIWSIMRQGQDVIGLLQNYLFSFLPTIVDLTASAVVLTCLFGLYLMFIITMTMVLFYWLTFSAIHGRQSLRRSWLDAWHEQHYQMTESTLNWSTACQFGRIPFEIQRYRENGDTTRAAILLWWFYDTWTRGLRHAVPAVSFFAACSVAALQIQRGQRRIGDFVVLTSYWAQLTGPLGRMATEISQVSHKLINAEKLLVLLEKTPRVQDAPDARPFIFLAGAVEFENVSFSYDGKRKVTDGISFRAIPGKTVALVGQTGGGKSTILKLLFRFHDADEGRILIDGQDLRNVTVESFRRHVAIVPQMAAVFNMSILDNVKYPDHERTDEEVVEACKAAALHDKIMSFTNGYQEKVGERGTKLSGGELQRLAIARAMLKRADILLLDEATSSVDSVTEKQIQKSLQTLCAGKTTFVIAHRLSTILHTDLILVIENGRVVESGTHDVLVNQPGAYHELWTSQLQSQPDQRYEDDQSRSSDAS
ncbi:hypothetical protein A1O1_04870 [Capronia coronata CBS 617.96]|uniref:Uncharacterized protein n=1 Tax=Capronia coronata CBS 617.96 TaxID=1182541 RepID=W9Y5Z1_9EURO|nr:uncharacterized protein A1O1_04870 [Capronia coronata CBS 617.96]EXJ87943.1 hypothetical protein A1O1_04870 [Capronia coronata CBS 617.96]